MKIAVLSGKGGTGKTFLAVNLAAAHGQCYYVDCDVEEPNGHLFFKPSHLSQQEVTIRIPQLNEEKCIGCQACVQFCWFHALAYTSKVIIFEELCHACGGCSLVCPTQALSEKEASVGRIQKGWSKEVAVWSGFLNPGQASGTPIIHALLAGLKQEDLVFIDCPPGAACIVMDSIKEADYCLLVAEPTTFGAANLEMVSELVRVFHKPHGVVLNKTQPGINPSEVFCQQQGIPILARIPFDNDIGRINASGDILAWESPEYRALFQHILKTIQEEQRHETITHP